MYKYQPYSLRIFASRFFPNEVVPRLHLVLHSPLVFSHPPTPSSVWYSHLGIRLGQPPWPPKRSGRLAAWLPATQRLEDAPFLCLVPNFFFFCWKSRDTHFSNILKPPPATSAQHKRSNIDNLWTWHSLFHPLFKHLSLSFSSSEQNTLINAYGYHNPSEHPEHSSVFEKEVRTFELHVGYCYSQGRQG